MNRITVGQDLNYVDYTDLLAKILLVLQKQNQKIFKISNGGKHLQIDIDNMGASQMCKNKERKIIREYSSRIIRVT